MESSTALTGPWPSRSPERQPRAPSAHSSLQRGIAGLIAVLSVQIRDADLDGAVDKSREAVPQISGNRGVDLLGYRITASPQAKPCTSLLPIRQVCGSQKRYLVGDQLFYRTMDNGKTSTERRQAESAKRLHFPGA